jgi:hypothetical protein
MTALPVEWPGGHRGVLEAFDGRVVVLDAPVAFAPGAPMHLQVRFDASTTGTLEARSVGSRRRPDGRFEVRARPVNLRRQVREALLEALGK